MAAVTICSDFEAPQNKVWHCFHCFPIYFPWSDDAMIFVFWMLSFKPTFCSPLSLSSRCFLVPLHCLPKGDQSWMFTGRTDAKAETPVLWPPHLKSWLIGKDPDAGRDWGQKDKGTTVDEMAGWHHRLSGHEFEWTWSWWWTGRPGVLQFMGSQRIGHDWATELNWVCRKEMTHTESYTVVNYIPDEGIREKPTRATKWIGTHLKKNLESW